MNAKTVLVAAVTSLLFLSAIGVFLYRTLDDAPREGFDGDTIAGKDGEAGKGSGAGATSGASGALAGGANSKPPGNKGDANGQGGGTASSGTASGGGVPTSPEELEAIEREATASSTQREIGLALLFVRVDDGNHAAVADVRVDLQSSRTTFSKKTGADGFAQFDELPPGNYQAFVSPADQTPLRASQTITLNYDERREVRFVLLPFNAEISGRVLDAEGVPIPNVAIVASPMGREEGENPLVRPEEGQVRSDESGRFLLGELAAGEYLLKTIATSRYPTVRRNVVAPASGVDLVLYEEERFLLYGTVSDRDGLALAGATVSSSANRESTVTDGRGSFQLEIRTSLRPSGRVMVSAAMEGYGTEEKFLDEDKIVAPENGDMPQAELLFRLEPVGEYGSLAGRMIDVDGFPVPGERVYLHSSSLNVRYHANTSTDGQFEFPTIRVAKDYRLWVYPKTRYRDAIHSPLVIEEGPNEIEIVLEPVAVGTLIGTIVDSEGRPLPRFTIHVRSLNSLANSVTTTSDASGNFIIEEVPAGDLLVETRSLPKLSVRGIQVEAEQETVVEIPVGQGNHEVAGVVQDGDGLGVAGARVIVTWSTQAQDIRSNIFNETITDADGSFRVAGFGVGECSVSVSAGGFRPARETYTIASDSPALSIQLGANQ